MKGRELKSGKGVREQRDIQFYLSPKVGKDEQSTLDGS